MLQGWGLLSGWTFVYVWRLELQRKLYIQGVIYKKTPGVPPSSRLGIDYLVGLSVGMGLCVCMEASATKDIIYTRGDF